MRWLDGITDLMDVYCHPLLFPLPEKNLELYLMREQQTAQGQTKRRELQLCGTLHINCFMETGLTSVADYPFFSPTRVALPFVLGIGETGILGLHTRLTRGIRPRLEGNE